MCGILCFLSATHANHEVHIDSVRRNLLNRGPDYFNEENIHLNPYWKCHLLSSVLHTQGTELTKQPLIDLDKNFFLWNGDVFNGLDGPREISKESDAAVIFQWLHENDNNILQVLSIIEGPYSFIFYDAKRMKLWFGRDPLGRHSLLWMWNSNSVFLTSVGHKNLELLEVPAIGLFSLDFSEETLSDLCLYPWSHYLNIESVQGELPNSFKVEEEINYFSFRPSNMEFNELYFHKSTNETDKSKILENILRSQQVLESVCELINLLTESCRKRVTIKREVCGMCSDVELCCKDHAKVAVLFSGGLDSTIIAFLADKFVPLGEPIDLINVAFSQKTKFDVPDRKTGLASYEELLNLCPHRIWNFIEVNVSDSELQIARTNHVCHLIHPLKTVLDDSLGCALWFACRGCGCLKGRSYKSTAKIILLGNGADEQFGGYTRHRNLLKRAGWEDLSKQLLKETLEISKRNLGRDDRVASDSGRQPRFPFLDEQVVKFAAKLPAWKKCGSSSFPPGVGDKLILRLAAIKMGLKGCATFPKRAFQFGCRIANSREKGQNECIRL